MKVLHRGVLDKEDELRSEREVSDELRKQLLGKEQANKIFNMKKLEPMGKLNMATTTYRA